MVNDLALLRESTSLRLPVDEESIKRISMALKANTTKVNFKLSQVIRHLVVAHYISIGEHCLNSVTNLVKHVDVFILGMPRVLEVVDAVHTSVNVYIELAICPVVW